MMLMALPLSSVIYFYYLQVPKCPWLLAIKKSKCEIKSKTHWLRFPRQREKSSIVSVRESGVFSPGQGVTGLSVQGWGVRRGLAIQESRALTLEAGGGRKQTWLEKERDQEETGKCILYWKFSLFFLSLLSEFFMSKQESFIFRLVVTHHKSNPSLLP